MMYDLVCDLDDKSRVKLKSSIMRHKNNMHSSDLILIEKKLKYYRNKLEKNIEKRNICCLKNESKSITIKEFETVMNAFELEACELELEIIRLEKALETKKYLQKKLNCFLFILSFPQNREELSVEMNGTIKKIYSKDLYYFFLKLILEEMNYQLKAEQKILQHLMLLNDKKFYALDEKHKYYLTEEQKKDIHEKILEDRYALLEVNEKKSKIKELDIHILQVNDFLSANVFYVYDRIFKTKRNENKKNLKPN